MWRGVLDALSPLFGYYNKNKRNLDWLKGVGKNKLTSPVREGQGD